jgi:cell division protein FtsW
MSDRVVFVIVAVLILFGIIFSYSLPVYFTHAHTISPYHFVMMQGFTGFLGISIIWGLSQLNPDVWLSRVGFSLFTGSLFAMLLMPFLPESIVPTINGAQRWIRTPIANLSPVEFFKIGFVFFLSWSLHRKIYANQNEEKSFVDELKKILPYGFIFLVAALLIALMQNDFGQVVILGTTLILLLLFAGSSFKVFLFLIVSAITGAISLIVTSSHRIDRIIGWWANAQEFILSIFPSFIANALRIDPETAIQTYQVGWSLKAIYHGGISGVGVGNGIVKLGFLSDVHTDFVLAGIAEETGLIGIFAISILVMALVYRIFKIANRSDNPVYYLFSMGIGIMIATQFLINALGIIGLIPLKGIAIPFISYGGSSMLALSTGIGMVLMLSKRSKL